MLGPKAGVLAPVRVPSYAERMSWLTEYVRPKIRTLFTRESMLASDWYAETPQSQTNG